MSKHQFQTEVNQLLQLIIHSLYSHKEIFLRELVSNASDAMDKLKLLTLTDENYKSLDFDPKIDVQFHDGETATLTVSDTGIGMNQEDLVENLGTIASSGTKKFLQNLSGDAKKDANMIGQFGVGFYAAFMVADQVEVVSRKAGEEKAWKWISDGKGEYEISEAQKEGYGTTITLQLNDEGKEFANRYRIETIIKKYSNHIPFPIYLTYEETSSSGEGEDKKETKEQKTDQINSASALWKRPKSDISPEDYNEFYKTISHENEDPLHYVHTNAEGTLLYTTLFFIPQRRPFDLFRADYQPGVKLYVKRVFITDDEKELLPTYLRFIRGVIDSEDLPLNVSREILQQNRVMNKIRSASVKKILSELEDMQKKDREKYTTFWKEFGIPIKEGLYQDFENKETLEKLVMFKSTKVEGYTTLTEYVDRMQADQKSIFYITGEREESLRNSPLLELYGQKDIEVLILDDEIDEIIISSVPSFGEKELKSVNRSDAADDLKTDEDRKEEKEMQPVLDRIKKSLGDKVKDVVASVRLSDSPACIVADQNDPTVQMQHILKAMGQEGGEATPILEVNPTHDIVKKLKDADDATVDDISLLLLEQSMLIEGMELSSPTEFVKRLNRIMGRAI